MLVILGNFQKKKIFFELGTTLATILKPYLVICFVAIFFEMTWHDGIQ